MTTKVMRPTKDGGVSFCSSSEDNVGKRRCNHIPGDVKFNVEVNQISHGLTEVVISDEYNELDEDNRVEVIKEFITTLKPISKKKLNSVLDQLSEMK